LKAFINGFVDHQNIIFTGFLFPDPDAVAGFEMFNIPDLQPQQIHDAKAIIDAKGEEQVVPGRVREHFGYGFDVFKSSDGINGDAGTFAGVVVLFHGASFCVGMGLECLVVMNLKYKLNIQKSSEKTVAI
jgi:hypothetical protein